MYVCMYIYIYIYIDAALAKTTKQKQETEKNELSAETVQRRNGKRPKRTGQPP